MVAVIDYGVGNLFSLSHALKSIKCKHIVTSNRDEILAADKIILPGVGAFGDAMEKLKESELDLLIIQQARNGVPLLGICLGMQLLFEKSFEYGVHDGLGLLKGAICPLSEEKEVNDKWLKIPHMGWNSLDIIDKKCPILKGVKTGDYVYYVHSYYAKFCENELAATSGYGVNVPGVVALAKIYGCQFHPEKSGKVGMSILRNFVTA